MTNKKFTTILVEKLATFGSMLLLDDSDATIDSASILTPGGITTGKSVHVGGGVTVMDDVLIGGDTAMTGTLEVADKVTVQSRDNSTGVGSGALIIDGGMSIKMDAHFDGKVCMSKKSVEIVARDKTTLETDMDSSAGFITVKDAHVGPKSYLTVTVRNKFVTKTSIVMANLDVHFFLNLSINVVSIRNGAFNLVISNHSVKKTQVIDNMDISFVVF